MTVNDLFRLDRRVAVVTGASKNLGLAIARAFAEAGATVVGVARGRSELEAQLGAIAADTGARMIPIVADVMDGASIRALTDAVHSEFSQIDILVNNAFHAGNAYGSSTFSIPDQDWDDTYRANVLGPYRLCRGFGGRMLDGRGGSIINVLSGSGLLPNPGVMPYGASKSALWMMTRYLAAEAAPTIRVNGLCPGLTTSETGGPSIDPNTQQLLDTVPFGRTGHPSEIAPAAVYLASDASSYTTGTLLIVNGGRPW